MAELITLTDIGEEQCEPTGGVEAILYWGLHKDFATLVDPKDICGDNAAATFAELQEIPASPGHTMASGKYLHKVNFTTLTGAIKCTMVGNNGARLYDNEVSIRIDGSEADLLGFMRYIRNKRLVVFIKEIGSGRTRQFGSKRLPARVEVQEQSIEATLDGGNFATVTIKDQQKWFAPIYLGNVDALCAPESE